MLIPRVDRGSALERRFCGRNAQNTAASARETPIQASIASCELLLILRFPQTTSHLSRGRYDLKEQTFPKIMHPFAIDVGNINASRSRPNFGPSDEATYINLIVSKS